MFTVPADTPPTVPVEETVARAVELLLQMPPVVASVKLIVFPIHTVDDGGLIAASAVTVTGAITKQPVLVIV
jgi:hypothetical protein